MEREQLGGMVNDTSTLSSGVHTNTCHHSFWQTAGWRTDGLLRSLYRHGAFRFPLVRAYWLPIKSDKVVTIIRFLFATGSHDRLHK